MICTRASLATLLLVGFSAACGTSSGAGQDAGTTDAARDAADSGDTGAADSGMDGPVVVTCASAGGTCAALVPGSCPNGVIGDGRIYSCGPGFGEECCLPGADGGAEAAADSAAESGTAESGADAR